MYKVRVTVTMICKWNKTLNYRGFVFSAAAILRISETLGREKGTSLWSDSSRCNPTVPDEIMIKKNTFVS